MAEVVRATGAGAMVRLINAGREVVRAREVPEDRHLFVAMSDIVLAEDGHILPADGHVGAMLDFVRGWDGAAPLLIHCYAGVSRSTAGAFITACALDAARDEGEIADRLLGRDGRMVAAVAAIGRGEECFEGIPFALELDALPARRREPA